MQNKNTLNYLKLQKLFSVILLFISVFYLGYYLGVSGIDIRIGLKPVSVAVINKIPTKKIDFQKFWNEWDAAIKGKDTATATKIYYASIIGMVQSLGDPYTSFLTPDVNKSFGDALGGKYEGIGAELGLKDNKLLIVAPLDGSPAKAAGVKSGDLIIKIDGVSTAGISVSDAVVKIKGPAGTNVTLTLQTGFEAPRGVTITRSVISVPSVTWEDKGNGIAYIRISRFGTETNKEWDSAVVDINNKMKELNSIIIDVRGNPGGYLESAVHISEEFFTGKPVVYEETATGEQIPLIAKRIGAFNKIPAVFVLVDEGSASASEILAAALRDNFGAKLIGTKTFGKGTIQDAKDFSDNSGLHITIDKWLTPKKQWINKLGLQPDVQVSISEEEITAGKDSQLDKAIELAKKI